MQIDPSPSEATTPFATTDPAVKLTFDASGRGEPHGHTIPGPHTGGDQRAGHPCDPIDIGCPAERANAVGQRFRCGFEFTRLQA